MPPFVEKRHRTQKSSKKIEANEEVMILATAKKLGLSFEELNLLTLNDFFDCIDLMNGKVDTTRMATQEDIDNFYRYM